MLQHLCLHLCCSAVIKSLSNILPCEGRLAATEPPNPCLAVLDNVIAVAAILVLLMSAFISDIYQHIAHRANTTNRGGSKENDKTKVCLQIQMTKQRYKFKFKRQNKGMPSILIRVLM